MPPRTVQEEQWDALMSRITQALGVTRTDLLGRGKTARVSWARQVACYALTELGWSSSDIAKWIHRDWSTVRGHAIRVRRRIGAVAEDRRMVEWVMDSLRPTLHDGADIEEAIQRIDAAIARATLIRGVLVQRSKDRAVQTA